MSCYTVRACGFSPTKNQDDGDLASVIIQRKKGSRLLRKLGKNFLNAVGNSSAQYGPDLQVESQPYLPGRRRIPSGGHGLEVDSITRPRPTSPGPARSPLI